MSNTTEKSSKKTRRWNVEAEKNELLLQQKKLREENEEIERQIALIEAEQIEAYKNNDGDKIALNEAKLEALNNRLARNDKRYKDNQEAVDTYSKITKNKSDSGNNVVGTIVSVITGFGGLAIAAIGLKKAYESDEDGTLVRKKTFDWIRNIPIVRDFGHRR